MQEFIDTHCHIHFSDYTLDKNDVLEAAKAEGVTRMICVGCTLTDSKSGVTFANRHEGVWASIGMHPHESQHYVQDHDALAEFRELALLPKVVAVGEIGLDYYYGHSSKEDQKKLLRFQLDVATEHNLPVIFHVRDAFEDFWHIFDEYSSIRGVIHSFTAGTKELEEILKRNLYVGVNGIMTFTKQQSQLDALKEIPLEKLVLETDAPYLTPVPYRGTMCEPKHVRVTAEFISNYRNEDLKLIAQATTHNAMTLFNLK